MPGTLLDTLFGWLAPPRANLSDAERREEEQFWLDRSNSGHLPERREPYDPEDKSREREFQIMMSCWM
jgi:hypothetical protein